MSNNKKVLVALSGGVDSAVSLLLLKKQGYDCIGSTMLLRDKGQDEDINAVKTLCNDFNIPFYQFDFRKEFKCYVQDYFVKTYLNANTPNPCIECNRHLKSTALIQKMKELGCSFLATGHYARIKSDNNGYHLYKAKDFKRDQSYFLYPYKKEYLNSILFPLGEYTKENVRKLAEQNNIKVAHKKDSEDVCFIENKDYISFIQKYNTCYIKNDINKEGDIVYQGKVVGKHTGLYKYTIGQRAGLGVSVGHPLYVLSLDKTTNSLILAEKSDVMFDSVVIKNINILENINENEEYFVKIRSVSSPQTAMIKKIDDDAIQINFKQKVLAPTIGQSAVVYNNDGMVMAGGVIQCVVRRA